MNNDKKELNMDSLDDVAGGTGTNEGKTLQFDRNDPETVYCSLCKNPIHCDTFLQMVGQVIDYSEVIAHAKTHGYGEIKLKDTDHYRRVYGDWS